MTACDLQSSLDKRAANECLVIGDRLDLLKAELQCVSSERQMAAGKGQRPPEHGRSVEGRLRDHRREAGSSAPVHIISNCLGDMCSTHTHSRVVQNRIVHPWRVMRTPCWYSILVLLVLALATGLPLVSELPRHTSIAFELHRIPIFSSRSDPA